MGKRSEQTQKIYDEHPHVVVKRSSAGLGLFAAEPIKRDEFVVEYTGEVITTDEADERQGKYLFDINSKWVIDGSPRTNLARYINHSCKPNCEPEVDERKKRVYIYAIKNIKPGEELTYDYGKDYFEGFIKPHGCRCDACAKKKK